MSISNTPDLAARSRAILVALVSLLGACSTGGELAAQSPAASPRPAELIVVDARVTTQDPAIPEASALAVRDGVFVAVGAQSDVERLRGPNTLVIDAGGRRAIPGLVDSHLHAIRGGRFYNLELRWDGVDSLAHGLAMLREQAQRTPANQWVRVIGGWSPYQFRERRMPTVAELNAASPEVPALVMFLYSRAFLNAAGVRALGITAQTPAPEGARYELVDGGAILHAEPNPALLYGTIAKLPALSGDDQLNSTQRFFRELNRFGLTSAIDAGGGGHAYPEDYGAIRELATRPHLPLRISSYLFAQKRGAELADFERWTQHESLDVEQAVDRANGYVVEGAGENLVWSAGDFENFLAPRPELAPDMEAELAAVTRVLVRNRWPIRIHATYDESITRVLGVFEPIFREAGYDARWVIDHAETISARNIARIRALGGGVAIQNRLSFAGELFAERYGNEAAASAPPLRALLDAGVPVGAGTDATRVSSYNPWLALAWLVTGRTVGGLQLAAPENRLTRAEALSLYTLGSAWVSGEEGVKGRIAPGALADFALLDRDFFAVPDDEIASIEAVLTVTGGDVVYASGPYESLAPALPAISPAWSPVARFGGFARSSDAPAGEATRVR